MFFSTTSSFLVFLFFFCSLLSFLGKTFKLRWIWWLELHFATLVRLAFRLGRDNDECFPKTFVQIFFPLLLFYFISTLFLFYFYFKGTDVNVISPKQTHQSTNPEVGILKVLPSDVLSISTLTKLLLYFLFFRKIWNWDSCMIGSDFR